MNLMKLERMVRMMEIPEFLSEEQGIVHFVIVEPIWIPTVVKYAEIAVTIKGITSEKENSSECRE